MGFADRIRESQARARARAKRMRDDAEAEREQLHEERQAAVDEYREVRDREQDRREELKPEDDRLSQVGDRSSGTLACPSCGGTEFKAKRSGKAKVIGGATVGVGALLAPKSRVECVACGETFRRG